MWIVTGTTASSGDQIIITGSAGPPQARASSPRNSVWPGWRKAGVVQRLLGDGVGDDGAGLAAAHVADGALDRFQDRRRSRGIGLARRDIGARGERRRPAGRGRTPRAARSGDGRLDRRREAERAVGARDGFGVGEQEERRVRAPRPRATRRAPVPGRSRRDRPSSARAAPRVTLHARRAFHVAERAQVDLEQQRLVARRRRRGRDAGRGAERHATASNCRRSAPSCSCWPRRRGRHCIGSG